MKKKEKNKVADTGIFKYSEAEAREQEMESILPGFYTVLNGKKIFSKSIDFHPWTNRGKK